ncbi:hypothetical protein ABVT39_004718 [Epinephelus coioides]
MMWKNSERPAGLHFHRKPYKNIISVDTTDGTKHKFNVQLTTKEGIYGTLQSLLEDFTTALNKKFARYVLNICLQYSTLSLSPVLSHLKEQNPSATTLRVISDGPTTQYRSKKNFYLLSTMPFRFGFSRVTWNFLEAGHGKGPADGVGAAIKRNADAIVARGIDVPSGEVLFDVLSMSNQRSSSSMSLKKTFQQRMPCYQINWKELMEQL